MDIEKLINNYNQGCGCEGCRRAKDSMRALYSRALQGNNPEALNMIRKEIQDSDIMIRLTKENEVFNLY